jgi:UDP-3-O-[3-hydroxymyristoyl] N-acetylglucosamine deacetylase
VCKSNRDLQTTVRGSFTLHGVGIHSGKSVAVTVHPAQAGGIRFVRADQPDVAIKAEVHAVQDTPRCTVLAAGEVRIATTEHLLAAFWALGIDHALVTVDGAELPILDGSAAEFVHAIEQVGVQALDATRAPLYLAAPVWVQSGNAHILAVPAEGLRVTYVLEYPHPQVGVQTVSIAITPDAFAEAIAPARTFGFVEWAEELRARSLALGASPENTVVITQEGTLTPLRFPDELVRHKILDLLGDLALLGRPLHAHIMALRSGHAANAALVRNILAQTVPEA